MHRRATLDPFNGSGDGVRTPLGLYLYVKTRDHSPCVCAVDPVRGPQRIKSHGNPRFE